MSTNELFTVVKIIDEFRLVINAGTENDIKREDKFLIFSVGEEIIDPETTESLGKLEIVKGTGKPIHIQDKLTTIESDKLNRSMGKKTIIRKSGGSNIFGLQAPNVEEITDIPEVTQEPFSGAQVGDKAKKIK